MTTADRYTYSIVWSELDQEHVGRVAEFPSLSWLAPTRDEAHAGIMRLVAEVVADMIASGETPPKPRSRAT